MLFLRPNATWQQGQGQENSLSKNSGGPRGPFSSLFFTLSYRQKAHLYKSNRRASDALGPRAPVIAFSSGQKPFFVTTATQHAQVGHLVYEYNGNEWVSPQETQQLVELNDSADSVMNELSQTDSALAALSAQAGTGMNASDLSLTAQQTFSRIDTLMQRWNLRAEEIERSTAGTQWIAINPATGSKYPHASLAHRPGLRHTVPAAAHSKAIAPQRNVPGAGAVAASRRNGDARRAYIKHGLIARPLAPSAQIKQRRLRICDKYVVSNTGKLGGLRQQMNRLAAIPPQMIFKSGGLRRVAFAHMGSLQNRVGHMAHELHEHRENIELSIQQRMNLRRSARSPLAAPVLKPKTKGETTT